MKDDLKPLFDNYRPELGDNDEYMLRLQQKMDALKSIKRYADEQHHLYRRRMVIAFVVGAVLGATTVVYILLHPVAIQPSANLSLLAVLMLRMRPLLTALTIAATSVGISVLLTLQPLKSSKAILPLSGEKTA